MNDQPSLSATMTTDYRPEPTIYVSGPRHYIDLVTAVSLFGGTGLIALAIMMGSSDANFFDIPSVLIVILGTIAVTAVSYTAREIRLALPVVLGSFRRAVFNPTTVAREMLDIATVARKRGVLYLGTQTYEFEKNPFVANAIQMVTDGMPPAEIDRLIQQDIDINLDAYRKAAGMMRRASEVAPAMGLIGTLIGLVQMLVALDNPAAIGPAMALALLTTFYGAVMGSMILAPLASKLERNAGEDALIKHLIHAGAIAIAAQENPRKLEMELNSLLPPDQRIHYFDF